MKKDFIGYYNPTPEEIEQSWSEGILAFDANTLLNLYRYTSETSDDFLQALLALKNRIYLPYQAAFEFMRNRENVISTMRSAYFNLENTIRSDHKPRLDNHINTFKRHPLIKIDKIQSLYNDFLDKVHKELEKQKNSHPDLNIKDHILDQVTELFHTCTGKDIIESKLEDLFKEGEKRYSKEVPPGYKDAAAKKGKPLRELYGDLIIWKDLIEYCKEKKKPIILITDDNKEDWWLKENGETKRPRPELIKEFFDQTGTRILIYNPDQFLSIAKERKLLSTIKEDTLSEIKDIRASDEMVSYIQTKFHLSPEDFENNIRSFLIHTTNNELRENQHLALEKALLRLRNGTQHDRNMATHLEDQLIAIYKEKVRKKQNPFKMFTIVDDNPTDETSPADH